MKQFGVIFMVNTIVTIISIVVTIASTIIAIYLDCRKDKDDKNKTNR